MGTQGDARAEKLAKARSILQSSRTVPQWQSLGSGAIMHEAPSPRSAVAAKGSAHGGRATLTEIVPAPLRQSGIVAVTGSLSIGIEALAEVMSVRTESPRWAAIFGEPTFGFERACQQGVDLSRVVVIPKITGDTDRVMAAAIDGIDIIVCGQHVEFTAAQQRRIAARIRKRGCFLLSLRPWNGADVSVSVSGRQWRGLESGHGWITSATTAVRRVGRGAYAQPMQASFDLTQRKAG
ncbi:hypothetical protein FB389_0407 [Rarobacter incanus]|uniref:Recombinase A n=1 Tax=Rarobacter incanus TaxID=153494 RepID=A0A542SMB7_9MICO|nr:hypothetical protein FB389_0407 [Rarobacter incanus]